MKKSTVAKTAAKTVAKAVKFVSTPVITVVPTVPAVLSSVVTAKQPDTKTKVIVSNRQIITRSVGLALQQRTVGSRKIRNNWGHFEGTIGAKIDTMISKAHFSKRQIQAYAGTKMSKVNSHINHLRKEKNFPVKIQNGIISFG